MHCPDMQISTCLLNKGINKITPSKIFILIKISPTASQGPGTFL